MRLAACTLTAVLATAPAALAQTPARVSTDPTPAVGYDSGGRRDPFVTLIIPRRTTAAPRTETLLRPRTGLAALALSDVNITGLTKVGDSMMAILTGPDKQSFVLHVNDRLLDASVKAIDQQGVVFMQQIEGTKPQEIRKTLRAAAEVIR